MRLHLMLSCQCLSNPAPGLGKVSTKRNPPAHLSRLEALSACPPQKKILKNEGLFFYRISTFRSCHSLPPSDNSPSSTHLSSIVRTRFFSSSPFLRERKSLGDFPAANLAATSLLPQRPGCWRWQFVDLLRLRLRLQVTPGMDSNKKKAV